MSEPSGVPKFNGTILKCPLPMYLTDKPFTEFGSPSYSWESKEDMTLIINWKKEKTASLPGFTVPEESNIQIEGCPLECPFDPNEDFDAAITTAIPEGLFKNVAYGDLPMEKIAYSIEDAGKLKQLLRLSCGQLNPNQVGGDPQFSTLDFTRPIYIATNGHVVRKPHGLDDGAEAAVCFVGGAINYNLCNLALMGPVPSPGVIDMDTALAAHRVFQYLEKEPDDVARDVHAVYEKIHGGFSSNGKVYIEFLWSEARDIFESPPPNAKVKLAIKPSAGDASPSLKALWNDIELLDRLMEIHKTYSWKEFHNSTCPDPKDISCSAPEYAEELRLLLLQQNKPRLEGKPDFSDSLENNLERAVKGERSDFDFTDRLWNLIAQKDGNLSVIFECLQAIFCEIESKNYRPYAFPGNKTKFIEFVKSLVSGAVVNFRSVFTPKFALELAIDCGVNKLFKDYGFVLRMCHLMEIPDLDAFAPKFSQLEESLSHVKKLHCLLEVLSLSKDRLGLAMNLQEAQTRKMARHFFENPLDWDHVYHFDINISALTTVMEGLLPIYWNLKLESVDMFHVLRTNLIYARDLYIGHVQKLFTTCDGILKSGYFIYVHTLKYKKPCPEE